MGHARSRSKPSMVAFDEFARSPAIEVLCGGRVAARIDPIPQTASMHTLKNRCIGSPVYRERKKNGAPGEVRTHDLQLRRLSLYPSELRAHGTVRTIRSRNRSVRVYFNACAGSTLQGFRIARVWDSRSRHVSWKHGAAAQPLARVLMSCARRSISSAFLIIAKERTWEESVFSTSDFRSVAS